MHGRLSSGQRLWNCLHLIVTVAVHRVADWDQMEVTMHGLVIRHTLAAEAVA